MTSFDKTNVIVSGSRSTMNEYANYITVFPKPTLVDGNVVLTQSMISKPNTKYVIKWNFDLNGTSITIPQGCLIEFDGGSFSNGTLVGNNTILMYKQPIEEVLDVTLSGTFIYDDGQIDKIDNANGMGKIYLKKDKSFASQITQSNTTYVIQHDFTLTGNVTIPENCILEFDGGSISGAYTITGQNTGVKADLVKIFNTDITLTGSWNVVEAYPEWFGAKGDGITDSGDAIRALFSTGFNIRVSSGTYLIATGNIVLGDNVPPLVGDGSKKTRFLFTDDSITNAIERINHQGTNWDWSGITIDGSSKSLGAGRNGIWSEKGLSSLSYGLHFKDVMVVNFSGIGFYIVDWFQQIWEECSCRNIGGDGIISGGDQHSIFLGSKDYITNVDGNAIWFWEGSPFIAGANIGDSPQTGLRLGRPSTHPKGAAYCRATIAGLNIESLPNNGYGIYCHIASKIQNIGSITIYPPDSPNKAKCGIYFESLTEPAVNIGFIKLENTSRFEESIHANPDTKGGFITLNEIGGDSSGRIYNIIPSIHGLSFKNILLEDLATKGTGKKELLNPVVVTSNKAISSASAADNMYLIDASNDDVLLRIDYAEYVPNFLFKIKRIDNTSHTVTISTYVGGFDNLGNSITLQPYECREIYSYDGKFLILGKN